MRLTVRLSTAAEAGFMSIPALPEPGEAYSRPDGTLDEAKARRDCLEENGLSESEYSLEDYWREI